MSNEKIEKVAYGVGEFVGQFAVNTFATIVVLVSFAFPPLLLVTVPLTIWLIIKGNKTARQEEQSDGGTSGSSGS